jgi:uncharacterized protein
MRTMYCASRSVRKIALSIPHSPFSPVMHTRTHPLISPALGTERTLRSFHYGPGGAQKAYIQAALHADELPGMLTAALLRRKLAALEEAGQLRGEIVVVPVANPIGQAQHVMGDHLGRFELGSMQNFNRNFHDLAELVPADLETRLSQDGQANLAAIRAALRAALEAQQPRTELESLRLALQKLSCDADIVLDLHCDSEAALHLYTNPELWPDVEPLARYLGAQASLLALNSIGNPFDEIHSFCWSTLRERFGARYPIPLGSISVTVELRGERNVEYALAEADAEALLNYLRTRGLIDGAAAAPPPLAYPASPLAGVEPLVAPISGILVFHTPIGAWIEAGQAVADLIDPLSEQVVTLNAGVSGVLYARRAGRFATSGMEVARIAGARPIRSGALLSA